MSRRAGPRMTLPTQLVLRALLDEPTRAKYGLEIGKIADLPSGTTHPILARLEGLGWVESYWEESDPHEQGRPRRRYYRLTTAGAERARIALASARTQIGSIRALQPKLGGGAA